MSIEDVREYLRQKGFKEGGDSAAPNNADADADNSSQPVESTIPSDLNQFEQVLKTSVEESIQQCICEFLELKQIKFQQIALVRRVFKRILLFLVKRDKFYTIAEIRRAIDPRHREIVPMLVEKCIEARIVDARYVDDKRVYKLNLLRRGDVFDYTESL